MPNRLMVSIVTLAAELTFSSLALAQAAQPPPSRTPSRQASVVPRRDLSGIWYSEGAGVHPLGFSHLRPPLTQLGEKMFRANKPGRGITEVPVGLTWTPTAEGSRPDLVRLLGGQVGGRYDVRRRDGRPGRENLAR